MKITKKDIEEAEQKDIITLAEQNGLTFKQQGKYFRCNEHDSLLVTGQKFFWNSRQIGGYGAISFATNVLDLNFKEALEVLLEKGIIKERDQASNIKEFNKEDLREVNDSTNVYNYLLKERCIDVDIIETLISNRSISEDEYGNAIFKWFSHDNEVVGANKRGTGNKKFVQEVEGSELGKGFKIDNFEKNEAIQKIVFCESPIDTISYFQMYDKEEKMNTRYMSLSGVKVDLIKLALNDIALFNKDKETFNANEFKIVLALDNDKAGIKATHKFINMFEDTNKIIEHRPKNFKDWNQKLQHLHKYKLDEYIKNISRKEYKIQNSMVR